MSEPSWIDEMIALQKSQQRALKIILACYCVILPALLFLLVRAI